MKTTKTKEQVTCKMTWRNSCTTMSRNCSACGEGGIWNDSLWGGWHDREVVREGWTGGGGEHSSPQDVHESPQGEVLP